MIEVVVVIHLLIAIVMILLILMQKSEGAQGGGFAATASVTAMSQPRARPNPLSRATTILGICFFATSLGLALLAKPKTTSTSIFTPQVEGPSVPKVGDVPGLPPADAPPAPSATPAEQAPAQTPVVPNSEN